MFITKFQIKNFKSFKDVTIHFNDDVNIFTGINNSGKTTVLEAISLWHECFTKLLTQPKKKDKKGRNGDWMLGSSSNNDFPVEKLNSVECPFFEDLFHNRDKRNRIVLFATLQNDSKEEIEIPFSISGSDSNYGIHLKNYSKYSNRKFNNFFNKLPDAIDIVYATPVAVILSNEEFGTDPVIKDKIIKKQSFQVIRNRLYKLINGADSSLYSSFTQDLDYILFNNEKSLTFYNRSNIQRDKRVLINFHIGIHDIEKDIALLGSGSLQTIEILLNLYQPGEATKELNLILLDEPDSHIHRDIQVRLINVLKKFGVSKQIFISTHNESLIRNSDYQHIFHMAGKPIDEIRSIDTIEIEKIQPHFKGIYPSQINAVIRSIGSATGLDFINAIECDRLIFVEGEDDARVLNILLKQQIGNRKKYMFWVMGGISEVFENINAYKTVFSNIKNGKSLWEKSSLVFDRDFLSDQHLEELIEQFKIALKLPAYSLRSYTFESSLFTDLEKLSGLIAKWFLTKNIESDKFHIEKEITSEYTDYRTTLEAKLNNAYFENTIYLYKNIKAKTEAVFNKKIIPQNDVQLSTLVRQNPENILVAGDLSKLMNRDDTGFVINKVVSKYGLSFSIETDFIELIKLVDKSLWYDEWNFINSL